MYQEYTDPQFKLAQYIAGVDGCEGGDMLSGIADLAHRSQDGYGYAMSKDTERFLRLAIDAELMAQKEWLSGDEAESIHGPEEIAEAMRQFEEYEKLRANKLQFDKWVGNV